jgi:hypothetical protein
MRDKEFFINAQKQQKQKQKKEQFFSPKILTIFNSPL